jgi:geranylgeranyl diphosphate synthase type II
MHSFEQLSGLFAQRFAADHFPDEPKTLYDPNRYFLQMGGKRVRPVAVLMGNELVEDIHDDAWHVATAIELFHNFTLIHDDIMDQAPLRRGLETVHQKYGTSTAILAGDVMLVQAYEYLNKISLSYSHRIVNLFNRTAREVCEGQQLDMDFERLSGVSIDDYIHMISLKTSVLLAASLKMGAIIGGASKGTAEHLYEFGKNLGIAFQIQDDYLDAFGDPAKFGKQVGGDILANKKTFLLLYALEYSGAAQQEKLRELLASNPPEKVAQVLDIFKSCGADAWALELKQKYFETAMQHMEATAVVSSRKTELTRLASFLVQRDY